MENTMASLVRKASTEKSVEVNKRHKLQYPVILDVTSYFIIIPDIRKKKKKQVKNHPYFVLGFMISMNRVSFLQMKSRLSLTNHALSKRKH